ncbi:MAG: spore cortex biosynthesis protein YabQ [Oscillospiraceae bacterium]|nr:spore cortex biosynthesis protein YabQ [Oscillospiraceae bacterium]
MEGLESFFTASQQLRLFVLSCLFGVPIGIIYDVFRALRIIFPHGKLLVALEDILFFVLYGIFLMCFTITAARSEFRAYFCAGNLLGFLIYFCTVGNAAVSIIKRIVLFIKKVLYFIFRPVNKKIVLIYKKCRGFFVRTLQKPKINKKNSETPLIVGSDLLYNNKVHKKNKRKKVKRIEKKAGKT